jgi:hypothetical protein
MKPTIDQIFVTKDWCLLKALLFWAISFTSYTIFNLSKTTFITYLLLCWAFCRVIQIICPDGEYIFHFVLASNQKNVHTKLYLVLFTDNKIAFTTINCHPIHLVIGCISLFQFASFFYTFFCNFLCFCVFFHK